MAERTGTSRAEAKPGIGQAKLMKKVRRDPSRDPSFIQHLLAIPSW